MITAMGMFIFPFLSLLLNTRLGYNELQIGSVMLYTAVANIMGTLIAGKLADEFGRKKVYLCALMGCVLSLALGGFVCKIFLVVPVVVFVYFFVSMTMPVLAAMVTDLSDESNRSECFSLLYLCTNIGFSMGPLIAGMLFYHYTAWIFWGQGISCFITALLVNFAIKDSGPKAMVNTGKEMQQKRIVKSKQKVQKQEDGAEKKMFSLLVERPILMCFVFCLAILTFCYIEVDFILPLQVKNIFGAEIGAKNFGLISACNGIVVVLATPIIVYLTKKRDPLFNLFIAAFLYAVGFGLYAVTQNLYLYMLFVAIWTSGEILVSTCSGVYIASHSPESHRARFQSLYEFARGIGKAFGPLFFGAFLLQHSSSQAWILISIICLITAALLFVLHQIEQKCKQE